MSHRDAPPRLSALLGRMLGRPRATAAARKSRASRGKLAQYRERALIHSCALPKPRTVDTSCFPPAPAVLFFFTAVLCPDRKKSLQLVHIDTDCNRSDGLTRRGILESMSALLDLSIQPISSLLISMSFSFCGVDVLRLDGIHDDGIGKPWLDIGDRILPDWFDVRSLSGDRSRPRSGGTPRKGEQQTRKHRSSETAFHRTLPWAFVDDIAFPPPRQRLGKRARDSWKKEDQGRECCA